MFAAFRLTLRTLGRSPGFAITAILALALGIGANSAIFSVINQVLLNPAGIDHPARVVVVHANYAKLALNNIGVSATDFADVRDNTNVFEAVTLVQSINLSLTAGAVPQRLQGAAVSAQWFRVFGARPRLGRVFTAADDQPGANQVVVLAFATWKRVFGQDTRVLNQVVPLNGKPYRIIGIMGPEFRWPANVELWTPLGLAATEFGEENRFNESYTALARLRPGVSLATARGYLQLRTARLKQRGDRAAAFASDSRWSLSLEPVTSFLAGDTRGPMLVLVAAVGVVLLIACANIAGLMLARMSHHAREMAVRAALGANSWRLVSQLLAESLLLSLAAAILGLGIALLGARALVGFVPANAPVSLEARFDARVILFTAAAALLSALLFGVAPAWQVARHARFSSLQASGRAGDASLSRQVLRSGLVVAEVALAIVLLTGAGVFLRSLKHLEAASPGFQPEDVLTANVSLPPAQYAEDAKRAAFYRAALDRLAGIPGAASVAVGLPVPFSAMGGSASFSIQSRPSPPGDPGPHGNIGFVSPAYFTTMGIPLKAGRFFTDQDRAGSQPVTIIDENLARQYWPNENPVGRYLRRGSDAPWALIVGVVGHVKGQDLGEQSSKGTYYWPVDQVPPPLATLLVRTTANPASTFAAMAQAVKSVDATQPIFRARPLSEMVRDSLSPRRFVVALLSFFSVVSLLLASLGLYGVISYAVAQRTREIGIRMALGARQRRVLGMVMGEGMRLAVSGAAIGFLASISVIRLVRTQLFGIAPFDPLTLVTTAVILISTAAVASLLPALRASRVDPMEALRYE